MVTTAIQLDTETSSTVTVFRSERKMLMGFLKSGIVPGERRPQNRVSHGTAGGTMRSTSGEGKRKELGERLV